MHGAERAHVIDNETVILNGRLEALQAIPGHVPVDR